MNSVSIETTTRKFKCSCTNGVVCVGVIFDVLGNKEEHEFPCLKCDGLGYIIVNVEDEIVE